jgi:acetyl/propionyl-CoA carboxylase alpha subunit
MIRKVLVANRGENALHARSANQRQRIESYLDAEEIVRAATATGADAIHPGYGFLSERTTLSAACERSGIVFIGPSTETIRTMGDKLESKAQMRNAGVPITPMWQSDPGRHEYPLLIKAVGGGGGKGMRLVEDPKNLQAAMASASREAASAFGDDRVFIEKYIQNPRHIEFQILGDAHGNVVHVFERECSIQRRHQKVIEESPSVAMTPELRTAMGDAAVRAAAAVGYRGAGTVEFILDSKQDFYFLEMNTRLQVEHPVTEMVTGLDLVREQIEIANGNALQLRQSDLRQTGHAIECRIYAEVPEEKFRPATGRVAVYRPPSGPGVRVDSGIDRGSEIGIHFDPLLAKLIVHAPSRTAAIERMQRALSEFVILGVRHNIEFLKRVISSEPFAAGQLDTHFLERHTELLNPAETELPPVVLVAASLAASPHRNAPFNDVWTTGPWRNT